MLAWISPYIVLGPTGAYHRLFERQAAAAGLPIMKVKPLESPAVRRSHQPARQN